MPIPIDTLQTPVLCVYLDKARANTARIIDLIGDVNRWRPHVKTTKLPEVWRDQLDVGVRHFKCATTREFARLLETIDAHGVSDAEVLLAYSVRGPNLARAGALARDHPYVRTSVICEDPALIREIHEPLHIHVDINPGMHRSGLLITEREAIHAVIANAGERFDGLHFYDGHVRGTYEERRAQADTIYAQLMELFDEVRATVPVRELISSGTRTIAPALEFEPFSSLPDGAVHRVSPGTVVFSDTTTMEGVPELDLEPAAVVLSRVISHPRPGMVTCDAGSKTLAAEWGDPAAAVVGWPGLIAQKPSEEHLPLEVVSGERPERGEVLALIPRHICPTVNLADEAILMDGERYVGVRPIAARGHEVGV